MVLWPAHIGVKLSTWRLGRVSASPAPVSWPGTQTWITRLLSVTSLMEARAQNLARLRWLVPRSWRVRITQLLRLTLRLPCSSDDTVHWCQGPVASPECTHGADRPPSAQWPHSNHHQSNRLLLYHIPVTKIYLHFYVFHKKHKLLPFVIVTHTAATGTEWSLTKLSLNNAVRSAGGKGQVSLSWVRSVTISSAQSRLLHDASNNRDGNVSCSLALVYLRSL